MRPLWKDVLVAVWLGILVPGIVLNGVALVWHRDHMEELPVEQTEVQETDGAAVLLKTEAGSDTILRMEDYLISVLLAEMPASFEPEALKAQAVAARTYAWKASVTGGKHGDGSLCGSSACCQGYVSKESYLSGGGTEENLDKVIMAVETTADEVLLYDGSLIEATYFSSSGGYTESALAVWGTDYPYLQSVYSPEENTEYHTEFWSAEAFQQLLGRTFPEDQTDWFGPVTCTEGGGVSELEIAGKIYTGVQLRQILGLRSTAFEITLENGVVIVRTTGYGHRVGLSQYGANAMARNGSSYLQILSHYYPGTELGRIS